MRPKTLLVLTLLVAVLGGFIALHERDLPSTEERAALDKKILRHGLDAIAADEIVGLALEGAGGPVELARRDGETPDAPSSWRLVAPRDARADAAAVDALLGRLVALESRRRIDGIDRAAAGLAPPGDRIALRWSTDRDAGEIALEIGAEVPGTSDVLLAVGDVVHQVDGSFVAEIRRPAAAWRDRDLFPGRRTTIDRVRLQGATDDAPDAVVLARRGDHFWIEEPVVDLADADLVNALLNELSTLEADSFVDDLAAPELAARGLDPPRAVVEVRRADRADAFRLELGGPLSNTDLLSARVDGQVVELRADLDEALRRPIDAWRARAWTPRQVFEIEEITLRDDIGTVGILRKDGEWTRDAAAVPYAVATDVLYAIAEARATEVISRADAMARGLLNPSGLDTPRLEITLRTEDGLETLRLFASRSEVAAAQGDGREVVLVLPAETAENLLAAVDNLRRAEPLEGDG